MGENIVFAGWAPSLAWSFLGGRVLMMCASTSLPVFDKASDNVSDDDDDHCPNHISVNVITKSSSLSGTTQLYPILQWSPSSQKVFSQCAQDPFSFRSSFSFLTSLWKLPPLSSSTQYALGHFLLNLPNVINVLKVSPSPGCRLGNQGHQSCHHHALIATSIIILVATSIFTTITNATITITITITIIRPPDCSKRTPKLPPIGEQQRLWGWEMSQLRRRGLFRWWWWAWFPWIRWWWWSLQLRLISYRLARYGVLEEWQVALMLLLPSSLTGVFSINVIKITKCHQCHQNHNTK